MNRTVKTWTVSAAFAAALCAGSSAFASTADDDARACADGSGQAEVDACSRVINSGQLAAADLAWAYDDRGFAYHHMGQDVQAIEDYDQAIALKSDDFQYYLNRGYAHKVLGHHQLATDDYTRSIALKPDNKISYLVRGENYIDTGDYALAIKDYTRAIEIDPKFVHAYRDRAYAKRQTGDTAGADADEATARALDGSSQ